MSFTLSYDYVGGPDVGYARTDVLCRRTRPVIRKDLTVESAVAVSGAAFASAMGRQSRAFQTLFALSNARLGTRLPNPGVLGALWGEHTDWGLPPMPGIRRLPYLLREVSGRYPMDDRMLPVTDGGHYENLGLVELLRHGVTTAVCLDAGGGSGVFAAALGEAIALAQEELGVEVTLARGDWEKLVPGSAAPGHRDRHHLEGEAHRTYLWAPEVLLVAAARLSVVPLPRPGELRAPEGEFSDGWVGSGMSGPAPARRVAPQSGAGAPCSVSTRLAGLPYS
ncbi:hypothetical protein ACH4VR_24655 [Streptomyces sp. NPDC020883]|uniref:hypothetical protein n=1 Tax=Streptomyces sp. NPDC020883 TaxID=3365099 RepID=UPI003796C638